MSHYIPNKFIQWHFASIENDDALIEKIRKKVDIPESVFQHSGYDLTADQYADLLITTTKYQNQESFEQFEQPLGRGSFRMMCYACITCQTLEQAILRCIDYYQLTNKQIKWRLEKKADSVSLIFDFDNLSNNSSYFVSFMMTIIWRWMSWMVDKKLSLSEVHFQFEQPDCYQEIEGIYRQKVKYSSRHNQLNFTYHELALPIKQNAKSLELFLINVPECLLSHYQQDVSIVYQLKEFLKKQPNINQVTLADASRHFCCSEQSLIRKLRVEGTKFKMQVDAIQKQRALELINKTQLSNQQIATELGFTDPSVFYRKFKKWLDKTPNEYRKLLT